MRVNWRVLLAVLGGLLLPVPLVFLLGHGLFVHPQARSVGGRQVSPMLSAEQRLSLQSYHRACLRGTDCEPPLGCLLDPRAGWFYCADSECVTDAQCTAGFSCQPLPTSEAGPLVRSCIPPGIRKEGESCVSIPSNAENACEPGLLCGKGWCGRPCQKEDSTSCPGGFFCADTIPGPACLPACTQDTCPTGSRCILDDRTGASACAVVYGQDCQRTPCSQGLKCMAVFATQAQVSAWMQCFPECGKDRPPCPEGLVCDRASCSRPCNPEGPNVCDPGFRCLRRNEQQPWVCRPDM
jgi:hypothetical protein